jgi:hypothetical protein
MRTLFSGLKNPPSGKPVTKPTHLPTVPTYRARRFGDGAIWRGSRSKRSSARRLCPPGHARDGAAARTARARARV